MTILPDGQYIIISGFSAKVYVLDILDIMLGIYKYESRETNKRTLHMSHDHRRVWYKL